MHFKQFYLACLAHASYLVGDEGECAIIDPQRDVDQYLEEARARELTIRHVIETHLHADFVSGHVELARRTGARVWIGARADALFEHEPARDGDVIVLGGIRLRFLETPGHTPESLCVLIEEGDPGRPTKVLTGDTLFIGDVGRPDLVGSKGMSARDMATLMYASLRDKLMDLPDDVEVYPAHGAGSACGRNISSALSSTIGEQKATNHALQPMTEDQFVDLMAGDLLPPPRYFARSAEANRRGPATLEELGPPPALSPAEVMVCVAEGALVLDVRNAAAFGAGHVPGAVNIGLDGNFAPWAGTLLDPDARFVLVAEDEARAREAAMRLARVGHHDVAGFLEGGMDAWPGDGREVVVLPQLDVPGLRTRLSGDRAPRQLVLDVRRAAEHQGGHVPGAMNIPVDALEQRMEELDPARPLAVICQTGYRSSAACSLLARHGFVVENVRGGTQAWIDAGFATSGGASVPT